MSQPLRVVTENLPPLQILQKDGSITGAMVEVVNLLLKNVNIEATIEVYPWARSYQIALEPHNTLIFSMFRDESREDLFQWIGELLTINSYLVSLQSTKNFTITSINDAKKYSIGTIREDLAEHYLRKNGFIENENLYLSSDYKVLWHMLYSGRTDLAFTNDIFWQHELNDLNLDATKVKLVYQIPNFASHLYLAASLDVDKAVVERIKTALSKLKASGEYQAILHKWNIPFN
ncbi:MAG: transporter substrate-binding domain-containing protein [Colwellia sp.]|nr:transporter substrate-binding domain-containing protein [Colwellia sp.]